MICSSSGAHSQASSLADDCVDAYVPVQSGVRPTTEEYIDMEASHRQHANANTNSSVSSAASSCSITTSGTPSTDMRFAEYQLDKIVSHFTPDDDDPSFLADRPIRAYSVGSRLEHNKRKLRVEMLAAEHCSNSPSSRVRAFSVGSKAKVARSDLYRGSNNSSNLTKTMSSDLVSLISTINNNNNNHNHNNNNIIKNLKTHTANNILNNNIGTAASKTSLTGGNTTAKGSASGNKKSLTTSTVGSMNTKSNSIDPMDDLMEIDFTKKDDDSLSNDSSYEQNHASCDDLMEIDCQQYSSYGSSTSSTGGCGSGLHRRKIASMPVGANSNSISSRASQPVPITMKRSDVLSSMMPPRQGYSFEQIEQQKNKDGYMNMKPVGSSDSRHGSTSSLAFNKNNSSLSSSPAKSINRPPAISSPAATHRSMLLSRTAQTSFNSDDYLNMSPISARSNQAQVTPLSVTTPTPTSTPNVGAGSAPEGYMEMSWGKLTTANATNNNNNTQSSSSSISSSNEYINMNFSGNIPRTSSASSDCSSGSGQNLATAAPNRAAGPSNSRMRSMPITIRTNKLQPTSSTQSQQCGATLPSQHAVIIQPPNHHPQSFAAGKMFPPSYLNINAKVSSALTQSDSLDGDVVTPTAITSSDASSQHSAAIFPFSPNSPNSGTNKQIFSSQQQTSQTQQQLPCEEQKRKCLVDGTTGEYCLFQFKMIKKKLICVLSMAH